MIFTHPTPADTQLPTAAGLLFGADRSDHQHKGVDLAWGQAGAAVVAAAAGTVVVAATTTAYGGPGIVEIDHGAGWKTRYLHLANGQMVAKGDAVAVGTQVGVIADLSSGPHLHFEVLQDGVAIDPLVVLGTTSGLVLAVIGAGLLYWLWRRR